MSWAPMNLGTALNTQCMGSLSMRVAVLAIVATALMIFVEMVI